MLIKRQFIILSSLIITIPILCAIFIIIHTYIHSPNRYLVKGSTSITRSDLSNLTEKDIDDLDLTLKMLPQEVEALLCRTSDRKIIYSTIPEIQTGRIMQKGEILSFASDTSDKYFYQFSRLPSTGGKIFLMTRLSLNRIDNEQRTKYFLKILFTIILITLISLILIFFIAKTIFSGLKNIEKSSFLLAEGNLNEPVTASTPSTRSNEFTRIMDSLEKMRCELVEIQSRKNRFVTGISHDLRTPVAVIKGYTEAITDHVISDPPEIQKSLLLIEQKGTELEEMIDTLINFMKLNNTEIQEKLVKQSITQIITDFARYAEVTGKVFKRNVKINIHLTKDIQVPLNDQLVQRSFENLLSNAIRYTKENDFIEITAYNVESDNNNSVIMQIKDNGIGISKNDLDYIFDLFYRGTNSRKEEGMGIGLSVVKSIMDTHGWKISVSSQEKKGSCFTITIPY